MTRSYDNRRRAAAAAGTTDRIAEATLDLLGEGPVAALTLQAVAARAEVSVQTVLRHAGSRDGCILLAGERLLARVDQDRGASVPGDVAGALAGLLAHYERDGRLVLALLGQEREDPTAREAVGRGRAYHRAWIERCFGPRLPPGDELAVDALVAATDLYLWKLLRLDLGRSPEATAKVIDRLVHAILEPR